MSQVLGLQVYPYARLTDPNGLRLLRLRPGAQHNDLHGELFISYLDDDSTINAERRTPYEAVSWFWGRGAKDRLLRVDQDGRVYMLPISENLEGVLRALREVDKDRILWVDALCIHQTNLVERNEQVPKMNLIYSQASCVLIWVGDREAPTDDSIGSDKVLDFISSRVLQIWKFDQLCDDLRAAKEWYGFINLMKRPWFSRRWVVQEIALARQARLHCGRKSIRWQDFADAVSLFVEVESATHRLSEVMRRDQQFDNIPEFFGHVPALGAALLVEATSNLFRISRRGRKYPLLSLEYLVSKYSVFEASQARDTVYAMLSVAKDTAPRAMDPADPNLGPLTARQILMRWLREHSRARESYTVDYRQPIIEVYREFIAFSIRKSDSLDVVLRPWAPRVKRKNDQAGLAQDIQGAATFKEKSTLPANDDEAGDDSDEEIPLPSWISTLSRAPFSMAEHPTAGLRMERRNADPLVGMPAPAKKSYQAAETTTVAKHKFRELKSQYAMEVEGFIIDRVNRIEEPARLGNLPDTWLTAAGWTNRKKLPSEELWRTIVADRSTTGENPPTFYPRACMEAAQKMTEGNPLNTQQLINEGRCTIVAQFLRRVQAVIWNRRLMRSQKDRLGLVHADAEVNDYICIFYGCSVPVVLRKHQITTPAEIEKEKQEQEGGIANDIAKEQARAAEMIQKNFRALLERRRLRGEKVLRLRRSTGNVPTLGSIQEERTSSSTHTGAGPSGSNQRELNEDRLRFRNVRVNSPEMMRQSDALPESDGPHGIVNGNGKRPHQENASDTGHAEGSLHNPPAAPSRSPRLSRQTTFATSDISEQANNEIPATPAQQTNGTADSEAQSRVPNLNIPSHYWTLVGECYVHGLMDGEAIEWQNLQKDEASDEDKAQGFDGEKITFELR